MKNDLLQESSAFSAIRRHLRLPLSDRGSADPMAYLAVETSKLDLKHLEAWERAIRGEMFAVERHGASESWKFWKSRARPEPWLQICSASGYTRENALRTLPETAPNAFVFALALRRLNDWVPQVRAAARAKLPSIAAHSPPEFIAHALWTILAHWASWGRMDSRDRQIILDLISIESVALAIKDQIVAAPAGPASLVLAQTGRVDALDKWLDEIAANAVQPSVRARAYRNQFERRATWTAGRKWMWTDVKWCKGRYDAVLEERTISTDISLPDVLTKASRDPSPMVRRIAGEFLIKHLDCAGVDSQSLAERLASDPATHVSERGRFAFARLTSALDRA